MINKNTYYTLPLWFIHSAMTISRAKSGKYLLTKADKKEGYYIKLNLSGINLKVPFRALFDTNDKIAPIESLSFSSAILCPSARMGYCQLNNSGLSCYAKNGQNRASAAYTSNGIPCINSFYNSELVTACINHMKEYGGARTLFKFYVRTHKSIVRFNLKGDFKNESDVYFLLTLVMGCPGVVFYGYTARDDLLKDMGLYEHFKNLDNFFLNGSNKKYTNRFKVTYELREWITSSRTCKGGCIGCKKCLTYRNQTILCLIHNKNHDIELNNPNNRGFIVDWFNKLGYDLTEADLKVNMGLLDSLNKYLTGKNLPVIADYKELKYFYYKTMGE